MKPNQIEELLENDQYNAVPGSDDDAKHWLTPLTGKLNQMSTRHHLTDSLKRIFQLDFILIISTSF